MSQIKKIKILNCPGFHMGMTGSVWVNTFKMPPLGLAQIAAYLRERNHQVDQDDLNIKIYNDIYHDNEEIDLSILSDQKRVLRYIEQGLDNELESLAKQILAKTNIDDSIDMLGLSAMNWDDISTILSALIIAKHVKKKYNIPVAIGGGIYSLAFDLVLDLFKIGHQQGVLDWLVIGPGEEALYKLINALNQDESLDNITGLVYFKNKKFIQNGYGNFIFQEPDFKGLPLELYKWSVPDYLERFFSTGNKEVLILPYQFIYGCPNRCIFCGMSGCNDIKVIKPKQIVENLKKLCQEYNTKYFFFLSNTINISRQFVNELCDEIIKQKLDILWSDCARFNHLDEKTLLKMKQAGCVRLIYGIETGSPRMLKYIQKGIDIKQASQMLKISHKIGIWNGLELIAGMPHETEKDIRATISFLKRNKKYIDHIYLGQYYLSQNSLLKTKPQKYGIENIRTINQFRVSDIDGNSRISQIFSYDEINGLSWKEKKQQILHSYEMVANFINKKYHEYVNALAYDELPFLFSIYKQYDKKNVRKKYEFFYKHIKTILSRKEI